MDFVEGVAVVVAGAGVMYYVALVFKGERDTAIEVTKLLTCISILFSAMTAVWNYAIGKAWEAASVAIPASDKEGISKTFQAIESLKSSRDFLVVLIGVSLVLIGSFLVLVSARQKHEHGKDNSKRRKQKRV